MIQRRGTFFLGIFIFLIPFLGLPSSWKTFLIILSGLLLVGLSVKIIMPRKNIKSRVKKDKTVPTSVQDTLIYPRGNIVDIKEPGSSSDNTLNVEQG